MQPQKVIAPLQRYSPCDHPRSSEPLMREISMRRREFLRTTAAMTTGLVLSSFANAAEEQPTPPPISGGNPVGPFTLPDLPYAREALAPHMSAETLDIHHGKHHQAYVTSLNKLVAGKAEATQTLEAMISTAEGPLFNHAAQHWNHSFFWTCMKPDGGGKPTGPLAEAINRDIGGYDAFRKMFSEAAMGQFGSGWAWLVSTQGTLSVTKTSNADLPMKHGQVALLTLDVWEHAYYIDYRNRRADYVAAFLDHLVDWEAANRRFIAG